MRSPTNQALKLLADHPDLAPSTAARVTGADDCHVFQALRRRAGREVCPCCGQVVRKGFALDRSKLKE